MLPAVVQDLSSRKQHNIAKLGFYPGKIYGFEIMKTIHCIHVFGVSRTKVFFVNIDVQENG